jgi:hypothetical protein
MAERAGLAFADVTSWGASAEIAVTDRNALLIQSEWETSTLRDLGFARVADPQWLLWIGWRARLADWAALEVAVAEDLSSFIAPDFSMYFALSFGLGGPQAAH